MTSSFQIKIHLSGEVGYLFWAWMNMGRKDSSNNSSRLICKQAIIKLLLAYSFGKMLFIGQNLKHVHVIYSFPELLIFYWLILDI